ncbi:MAG TPA: phosphoribosylamine--glycine ligase [Ferruginibacter sp.]|nr:phosphoribosylamine--glycine ligase [Ferruginibacter sp.]
MNILIIGSGGREHTLAWKLKQSPLCDKLFIAPGNAGTAQFGSNVAIGISDFEKLSDFCVANTITMLVVGPEEPLVKGVYDFFKNNKATEHIQVIGPSKEAAQLEGSKAYAKAFMQRHKIPTAAYAEFDAANYEDGVQYIRRHALPIVLKADGLAAGKGVLICQTQAEALTEFELMIQQSKFGAASNKVVIEEFLDGIEMSSFVLTDGKNYVLLPEAKDYKRIGVNDTGLNTGGMGAVSPVPFADETFMQKVITRIVEPTIAGFHKENLEYKGVVFIGLIKVNNEPLVIEYNCRFGDPETEVIIPRTENDLVEVFSAVSQQRLNEITIKTSSKTATTVVAVSGGYPNEYTTGKQIDGLDKNIVADSIIFHAGTTEKEGKILSNGGRVLVVTSFGDTISAAAKKSNQILAQIHFEGMYFRADIGYEFA